MRTYILTAFLLLLTHSIFSQQKLLIEKDSVSLHVIFSLKETAICNCNCPNKDKKLYHYSVSGKIVNHSSKSINFLNVLISDSTSKNLLENCKVKNAFSNTDVSYSGEISIPAYLSYTLKEACCDWSTGLPNVKWSLDFKFSDTKKIQAIATTSESKSIVQNTNKPNLSNSTIAKVEKINTTPPPVIISEKKPAVQNALADNQEKVAKNTDVIKPNIPAAEIIKKDKDTKPSQITNEPTIKSPGIYSIKKTPQSIPIIAKAKIVNKKRLRTTQRFINQNNEVYLYLLTAEKASEICKCSCPLNQKE